MTFREENAFSFVFLHTSKKDRALQAAEKLCS